MSQNHAWLLRLAHGVRLINRQVGNTHTPIANPNFRG
jgi:hypothetical protein